MSSQGRKVFAAVFAYPNNHATSTIDHVNSKREDIDVNYYYWIDFPSFRKDNHWKIPSGASHLRLSRPFALLKYVFQILRSDNVYFQSFSSPRIVMALLFWSVIRFGKCEKVFLASEGMKKQPSTLARLVISRIMNSTKVIHLGIGTNASQNFYDAGMRNWTFRKYCFCEKYQSIPEIEKTASKPLRILSIGQLIERKRHDVLLRAISNLNNPQDVNARIAGNGEDESKLVQLANELGISGAISFLGFCSHETLHDELLKADVFVLLSRYDGWGVVVGHALNYGLPIIVSDGVRSGRDFLVEPGVNGYICSNEIELAEQLETLLESPSSITKMGAASRKKAEAWNIETTSERLGQLVEDPMSIFDEGPLSSANVIRS